MKRPIKADYLTTNQMEYDSNLRRYYEDLEKYVDSEFNKFITFVDNGTNKTIEYKTEPRPTHKVLIKFHVHKGNLKRNEVDKTNLPPIICTAESGEEDYAHLVIIYGQDGKEAARMIYNPEADNIHSVKVWVETENRIDKIQKL
jgi:hypothetical protein